MSSAVLLAIILIVLVKGGYVRFGSALFGCTLAAAGLAPTINSGLVSLAGLISSF
ncbi:hypothetical protein [Streptomyces sp. NPDC059371]|uniref:hypothetical protein n=1 Tax=Streptomyces sp. NPDC059371 TaxID=3346812 RepID=UPI00368279BC